MENNIKMDLSKAEWGGGAGIGSIWIKIGLGGGNELSDSIK